MFVVLVTLGVFVGLGVLRVVLGRGGVVLCWVFVLVVLHGVVVVVLVGGVGWFEVHLVVDVHVFRRRGVRWFVPGVMVRFVVDWGLVGRVSGVQVVSVVVRLGAGGVGRLCGDVRGLNDHFLDLNRNLGEDVGSGV